jgi:hypothetical protein
MAPAIMRMALSEDMSKKLARDQALGYIIFWRFYRSELPPITK